MVLFHGRADDPSGEVAVYSVAMFAPRGGRLWLGPTGGKSRAKFPCMTLGGSTKPISLTMEIFGYHWPSLPSSCQ